MLHLKNGMAVPSPRNLMLFLTQDCQLRCTYCFEEHRKNEQMSLEIAKKAVDMVYHNTQKDGGSPSISLFGGEPMLRWDDLIVPLTKYIRENYRNFGISMTTNGLLLNQERLDFINDYNITFMLSIDGSENGHNATRQYADGRSTFAELEPIIKLILKSNPSTPFRMTITPENVRFMQESVLDFHNWEVRNLRAFPNIYIDWSKEALRQLDQQLKLYNQYVYDCFTQGQRVLLFDIYSYFFKKIVAKQYELENDHYRSSYFCQTCNRCGIGLLGNFMCNHKGDIFTCDRYVVADDSNPCFVGSLDNGIDEERVSVLFEMCDKNKLHSTSLDCSTCPLDYICTGGCIPVNYQLTGDFTEVPLSYCRYNQIVYNNVMELLNRFEREQSCDNFRAYFQDIVQRGLRYVG